jgi:hypothetical protein
MVRTRSPGLFGLAAVLVFFFVTGAAMAFVIWMTLSDFLAGHPVEGGRYLLAMAMIGLFVAFAWFLARYLQSAFLPSSLESGAKGSTPHPHSNA